MSPHSVGPIKHQFEQWLPTTQYAVEVNHWSSSYKVIALFVDALWSSSKPTLYSLTVIDKSLCILPAFNFPAKNVSPTPSAVKLAP